MHEELKKAVAKILEVAKENKKNSGIYSTSGEQARQFADQGFQMVTHQHEILHASADVLD